MSDERKAELLREGDRFGDYTVVRLLGKGGMGAVYLMRGTSGSEYAVKIMFPDKVTHDMRRRFAKEAEFAIKIRHRNLISVYDVGEDPETGLCYMIMDYVPGGSLADRLKAKGRFSIQEAVSIASQIAAALDVAHRHGLVHRDIKPDNIMFDADGTPRLADLGVAKFDETQQSMVTATGMVIGTPAYMAPEQMLNSHEIDARADIYSLGVVLYEMLSGKRPNEGRTAIELMAKAIKGEPLPDIKTICPELSVAVAHVVSLLCAPKPDARPRTALAAADMLHKAASGKLVLVRKKPQSSAAEAAARRTRRSRLVKGVAVGVGMAAFLFVGIAGWVKALGRREPAKVVVATSVTNVVERVAVVTNVVENTVVNVVEKTATNVVENNVGVTNAVKREEGNKVSGNSPRQDNSLRRQDNSLHQTEVNGFRWTYRIREEGAVLSSAHFQALLSSPCVSPAPSNVLKIPSRLDGMPVVEIGRFAFNKCAEITEAHVPEGVLRMSYGAFCHCRRLERVVLPSTLSGDFAESFKYCPGISRIEFASENPNYVIGRGVVYSRDKTKLVMMPRAGIGAFEIPETVREIAPYAFDGSSVKFMNIPAGVRKIGNGAFFGCGALVEVVFNAPLEYMGTCVFGYSGLKRIAFPPGTRSIPSETFRGCSQLAAVGLPDTLEKIEGHATFENCSALEELQLPHGLRKLGESQLFGFCSSLKRLTVPASVESMSGDSGTFRRCSQLREIVFEGNAPALTGSSNRGLMFEDAPEGVRVVVKKGSAGWSNGVDQSLPEKWPADAGKSARPIVYSSTMANPVDKQPERSAHRTPKTSGHAKTTVVFPHLDRSQKAWAYSFEREKGWEKPDFNDSRWKRAQGGFGFREDAKQLPRARLNTHWGTEYLFVRRHFSWAGGEVSRVVVDLYHDDEVYIYLNGRFLLEVKSSNWDWQPFEIPADRFAKALKEGDNVFCAVTHNPGHCGYFDCGLVVECGGVPDAHAGPDDLRKVKTAEGTWTVRVVDGVAQIGDGEHVALEPMPKGTLKIPSELDGLPIRRLGQHCFLRCNDIESVVIPEGIRSIHRAAFYECGKLTHVSIPESLEYIGFDAFVGTSALTRLDIKNVRLIDTTAFGRCFNLKKISVAPDNPTYCVREGVLYDKVRRAVVFCPRSAKSFAVAKGIEEICEYAFQGSRLKSISIPDSVCRVGHFAFSECPHLEKVVFKGRDAIICSWAFGNTPSLKSVVLPSHLRWLDDWSIFQGAGQLESIKLPETVEVIDDAVFAYCPKLKNIYLGKSLRYVDIRAFAWCPQLQEISFPATLKVLRAEAFVGSSSLKRVSFAGNAPELQDNDGIFGRDIYKGTSKSLVTVVPKGSTGWLDGSANLPKVWPVDGGESARQIRHGR